MKTIEIKRVKHYIFENKEEFEKYFMNEQGAVPKLVYEWKESNVGDWVMADDGGIVQILYRGVIKPNTKRETKLVRTAVGLFNANQRDKIFMDTDITIRKYPQGRYQFTKKYVHWHEKFKKRIRLSKNEIEFVRRVREDGLTPTEAYTQVFKCNYIKSSEKKAKHLLKQPRIIGAFMGESPKEIAKRIGIDEEYVLKKYKKMAEEAKNENVKLQSLDRLSNVVEINKLPDDESRFRPRFIPGNRIPLQLEPEDKIDRTEDVEVIDEDIE
jgi:hypothetical protein